MRSWSDLPIIIEGIWGASSPSDVEAVIMSFCRSTLSDFVFDNRTAPAFLRVLGKPDRPYPQVWARDLSDRSATIILSSVDRRWAQLGYQFGHELGHVLCGSWTSSASEPKGPSHWLEEALVDAFSLYGLWRMSQDWRSAPPYPTWESYSCHLEWYATETCNKYTSSDQWNLFYSSPKRWFQENSVELSGALNLTANIHPIIPWLFRLFEKDHSLTQSLVAMNHWPERGACPLPILLCNWQKACVDFGVSDALPLLIRDHLHQNSN